MGVFSFLSSEDLKKLPVSSRRHGWKRSVSHFRPWCFVQSHVDGLFISTELLPRVRAAGSFTSGFSTAKGAGNLEHLPVSACLPCVCCCMACALVVWTGVFVSEFLVCPSLLLPWLGFQLDNKTLVLQAGNKSSDVLNPHRRWEPSCPQSTGAGRLEPWLAVPPVHGGLWGALALHPAVTKQCRCSWWPRFISLCRLDFVFLYLTARINWHVKKIKHYFLIPLLP